jgi:hypothetical protein
MDALPPACPQTCVITHTHTHTHTNKQVLQLEEGTAASPIKVAPETFNVRLEELAVIDLAFLAPTGRTAAAAAAASSSAAAAAAAEHPVVALLYEDNKQARHIKTYTLNLQTKVGSSSLAFHNSELTLLKLKAWHSSLPAAESFWSCVCRFYSTAGGPRNQHVKLTCMANSAPANISPPPPTTPSLLPSHPHPLTHKNRSWRMAPGTSPTWRPAAARSSQCLPPSGVPSWWARVC